MCDGTAKTTAPSPTGEAMDPRVFVYGLFTAIFYAWEIHASNNYTAMPLLILVAWIFVLLLPLEQQKAFYIAPFLLLHASHVALRSPCTFEAEIWGMQTDTVMALWVIFASSKNRSTSSTSTIDNADVVCRTMRDMFSWYYFASGFWKLNSHFWNPDGSCATMFFVQLVARFVSPLVVAFSSSPDDTILTIASTAKTIAPAATLLVEVAMGGFQVVGTLFGNRTCEIIGVLLALKFHLFICILPPPNDIANFALICGSRLIVFASAEGTRKALAATKSRWPLLAAVAVCAVAIGGSSWSEQQWAFALYVPIGSFVTYAILAGEEGKPKMPTTTTTTTTTTTAAAPKRRPRWGLLASGIAFFYSYGSITLGLQEESTPNMFANLKVHGGSNHWLLPTGLLFHAFGDYPDSHPFGGGEVRIEKTTSKWLKTVYPNDLSGTITPPLATNLMERLDHPEAFYFNGGLARVLGITPPQAQFYQYTVPALELKRLFQEAKRKDQNFDLTYAQLPGTKGDEVWRTTATRRRFHVTVRGGEVTRCAFVTEDTGKSSPCGPDDLPMLGDNSIPFLLQRISMYNAYPIVPTISDEIAPTISCFGP